MEFPNGNSGVSVASAAAIEVTGDIDLRWFGYFNDWSILDFQTLMSKHDNLDSTKRGWWFWIYDRNVQASFSNDGTTQHQSGLAALPAWVTNGTLVGIRVTRVKATGVTTAWFSGDGETWEAAGTATLGVNLTIFNNTTTPVMVNGLWASGFQTGSGGVGRCIWAELRNGIDGTVALRIDEKSYRGVARKASTITATTGQTVTRRGDTLFYPTVDTRNRINLYHGGTRVWPGEDGYARFSGEANNKLSIPHKAAYNMGNRGSCWVVVRPRTVWSDVRVMAAKWWGTTGQSSWQFTVNGENELQFVYSRDGSGSWGWSESAYPLTSLPMNEWYLLGVKWYFAIGQTDVLYYAAPLGMGAVPWDVDTTGNTDPLFQGTNPIEIGGGGTWSNADIASVIINNEPAMAEPAYLSATIGTASTPDPGPLPQQFTLIYHGRINTGGFMATQAPDLFANYGWTWHQDLNGPHHFDLYPDGSNTSETDNSCPSRDLSNVPEWHALSVDVKNGSNQILTSWYSFDNINWHKHSTASYATVTPFNSTGPVRIGDIWNGAAFPHGGRLYRVLMRTGLHPAEGGIVWDFDASYYTSGTTFTSGDGRTWTLTSASAIIPAVSEVAPTEVFRMDRESFEVQRRATTMLTAQGDTITIHRSGANPTRIHPTVSEMGGVWGYSQLDDGTKVVT
jgi:hypothetical protein